MEKVFGWQTAIQRNTFSVPVKYLLEKGLLDRKTRILDYGCGRGYDADHLGIDGYDPAHRPDLPVGLYDVIFCNYVLNVIANEESRKQVVDNIRNLLKIGGIAYISVRRDIKCDSKSQFLISLDLPVQTYKPGSYIMYRLEK